MVTLAQVKEAQPEWFSRQNKRFFGDISYRVLHSKTAHEPYLIRATHSWSDMFGAPKKLTWRINPLNNDLHIMPLVDTEFGTLDDVKEWLKS